MIETALLGFLSGGVAPLLQFFQNRQDNKQELEVMKLQNDMNRDSNESRFDMSVLQQEGTTLVATIEHDNKAGQYKATTWLGRWLFDLVSVWRAAMRPFIVSMLILYYGWIKYHIVEKALPHVKHWTAAELDQLGIWTVSDYELLLLGVTFYLGKRTFEKMAGHK